MDDHIEPQNVILPPRNNSQVYEENGRFYGTFRKGKYMFPVDEMELERMDIFHKFFTVARGDQLFSSPIRETEAPRILDLGCGTGIWGIDVADKFPNGTHVGVDLNLVQPEFIPRGVQFIQADLELPWQELQPNSWDLVHIRMLNGSITHWSRIYHEAYRHCKPYYGHIEQVEIDFTPRTDDGTLPQGSYLVQWADELMQAMDGFDRSIRLDVNTTRRRLADAGFVDLREEVINFALNGWPEDPHRKKLGRWFNLGFIQGLQAFSLAPFARGRGKTLPEIELFLERVAAEVRSLNIHAYFQIHIFIGRRPE